MNKITIKGTWLIAIPFACVIMFVALPQLQHVFGNFSERGSKHQGNIERLETLRQIEIPSAKDEAEIFRLETMIAAQEEALEKERYVYYKVGGILMVVLVTLVGVFGAHYHFQQKKQSDGNKTINFSYSNFFTDSIGQQISWEAVKSSGSNYLSGYLKPTQFGHKISPSYTMLFIGIGLCLIGVNQVLWTIVEYARFGEEPLSFMKVGGLFMTSGGFFLLIGFFFLVKMTASKVTIHQYDQKVQVGGKSLDFDQLHALQVLQKFMQGNRRGGYYCYELNLITRQGERYNLLNHGDKAYLLSDMVKLSEILKLPVWNNGVT